MIKNLQRALPRQTLTVAVATSLGLLASSPHAVAQGMQLEEVVVTAQKRAESSQDTPISITAFSEANVENRRISNIADLIGNVPGVNGFSAPGSRASSGLNMRGVSGGSPANLSLDPAVATYLDGVYVGKLVGSAMDVAEIERIEVLRGPQGTLYGRNATGGAVNFISKKPTGEFGGRITGSLGNYDYWAIKGNVNLPALGEVGEGLGELASSFGFQTRQRDDFYKNSNSGEQDFDNLDREAYRIALQWTPRDNFVADYVYDKNKLDEHNALQQVVAFNPVDAAGNVPRMTALRGTLQQAMAYSTIPGADPRISSRWIPSLNKTIDSYQRAIDQGEGRVTRGTADFAPYTESDVEGHALTLTWDAGDMGLLGDVTFKSITAHRELDMYVYGDIEDLDSRLDANGVGAMTDLVHLTLGQIYGAAYDQGIPIQFLPIDALWGGIDELGAFHSKQDTQSDYKQFSQEIHMVGTTDNLEYVLGAYYFDDESSYLRKAIFAAPVGGFGPQAYDNSTEAFAVFGQATMRPSILDDRLALTLGLRYTEETKEIDYDYSAVVSPFGVTPARATSNKANFYNMSGNFTIAYDMADSANVFLRYATGYRSGGFNGEIFDNAFKEETIEQWELGIKSDWWDRRLRINGSIYTYIWEDVQVSQIKTDGGVATSLITNAGKADRWGGELEVTVAPAEDLIVSLSYAYVDKDFEEYPPVCGTNEPINCIDSLPFAKRTAPGNQFNISADYIFARTSYGEITGYVSANWQDEWPETALWSGVVNGEPSIVEHQMMDARTLVNARLSLEQIEVGDGLMKISIWGRNLTDDDYPTFATNFGSLGPIAEQYGEPRTYGIDLTYDF